MSTINISEPSVTIREKRLGTINAFTGYASGIIGEDIESVADKASKELGIPVVTCSCEGFRYDEVLAIENEDAFEEGRRFALSEGILVGISSGAALKAARILAEREEYKGKNIVVLLPDSGDRYLSTALFAN